MKLTDKQTRAWLLNFSAKINEKKQDLNDLDQAIGDGDHGSNMARGVHAVEEAIKNENHTSASEIMKKAAMAMVSKVGGASGPLYGTAFLEMAKVIDTEELSTVLAAGLDGVKKRSKADADEKTMVDMWAPVVKALQEQKLTKDVINESVEATKELKATKGRASYLNEGSIGHLDPGSVSSSYLFFALLEEVDVNE